MGEFVEASDADAGPWPAFADLFAATSLLFLILFAAVTIPAIERSKKVTAKRTTLTALNHALAPDTVKGYQLVPFEDHLLIRIPDNATFAQGRYELSDMRLEGRQILDGIADRLRQDTLLAKIDQIAVVGHTSSEGLDDRNWLLSAQRAVTVATYLVTKGHISACQVGAEGRGEFYPVDPVAARKRSKADGMPQDRRIELEIRPVIVGDSAQMNRRAGCVDRDAATP